MGGPLSNLTTTMNRFLGPFDKVNFYRKPHELNTIGNGSEADLAEKGKANCSRSLIPVSHDSKDHGVFARDWLRAAVRQNGIKACLLGSRLALLHFLAEVYPKLLITDEAFRGHNALIPEMTYWC